MAVAHLVSPPKVFYRYWRMSFIDFVASELGLWVTLFTTTEIGLAVSVGFCIVYTLLRLAFPHWSALSNLETQDRHVVLPNAHLADTELDVLPEAFLVRYTEDVLFPNASRIKSKVIDKIKVRYDPVSNSTRDMKSVDRSWNVAGRKRIEKLRRRQHITPFNCVDTPLKHVVLDFGQVGFIDVSGIFSIIELKMELRRYIGEDLQFRFFGMNEHVRERFDRADWKFAYDGEERSEDADVVYRSLESALLHRDGDNKYEIVKEKTLEV
jgi:sodium-independent sulfate anion transporter 11